MMPTFTPGTPNVTDRAKKTSLAVKAPMLANLDNDLAVEVALGNLSDTLHIWNLSTSHQNKVFLPFIVR